MRCAAIDIGSNAVRLLIAEQGSSGRLKTLADLRVPLRLGQDTFTKGFITKSSREKLVFAFQQFLKTSKKYDVDRVVAIATSAFREAKNGNKVIREMKKETGIPIQMINGRIEATMVHRAVHKTVNASGRKSLLLDIGGGSLELVVANQGRMLTAKSLPLGTVRLLHDLGPRRHYQAYADRILDVLEPHIHRSPIFQSLQGQDLLVGTGGNLRALGKLSSFIKGEEVPRRRLTRLEVREMASLLFDMSYAKRIKRLDLRPDRADVILPATVLVLELMKMFRFHSISVPNVGIKTGVLHEMMNKRPYFNYTEL